MFRFYAHLYLKTGLGPVLGPYFGLCIGPILVEIVVNDIIVSQMFNFSPLNHYIFVSGKRGTEFSSKIVKFGHFWPNYPHFASPWDPLQRGSNLKSGQKFVLRAPLLLQVGHLVFKVDLVLHFSQKLEKTSFFIVFLYISIVKSRKSQILLSGAPCKG